MLKKLNHRKMGVSFVLVFFLLSVSSVRPSTDSVKEQLKTFVSTAQNGITRLTLDNLIISLAYTNADNEMTEIKHIGGKHYSVSLKLNLKRKGKAALEAYRRFIVAMDSGAAALIKKAEGGMIEDSYSIIVGGVRVRIKYKDDNYFGLTVFPKDGGFDVISIRNPRIKEKDISDFGGVMGFTEGVMYALIKKHVLKEKDQRKKLLDSIESRSGGAINILDKLQWKAASGKFSYRNLRCKKSSYGNGTSCLGELRNYSGKNYQFATFDLSAYDENGSLLDVTTIRIMSFRNDTVKTFKENLDVDPAAVSKYKIRFDSGM